MLLSALDEQLLIFVILELGLVFVNFHGFLEILANEIDGFLFQKGILVQICIGQDVDHVFQVDICPDHLKKRTWNNGITLGGAAYMGLGGGGYPLSPQICKFLETPPPPDFRGSADSWSI